MKERLKHTLSTTLGVSQCSSSLRPYAHEDEQSTDKGGSPLSFKNKTKISKPLKNKEKRMFNFKCRATD